MMTSKLTGSKNIMQYFLINLSNPTLQAAKKKNELNQVSSLREQVTTYYSVNKTNLRIIIHKC